MRRGAQRWPYFATPSSCLCCATTANAMAPSSSSAPLSLPNRTPSPTPTAARSASLPCDAGKKPTAKAASRPSSPALAATEALRGPSRPTPSTAPRPSSANCPPAPPAPSPISYDETRPAPSPNNTSPLALCVVNWPSGERRPFACSNPTLSSAASSAATSATCGNPTPCTALSSPTRPTHPPSARLSSSPSSTTTPASFPTASSTGTSSSLASKTASSAPSPAMAVPWLSTPTRGPSIAPNSSTLPVPPWASSASLRCAQDRPGPPLLPSGQGQDRALLRLRPVRLHS